MVQKSKNLILDNRINMKLLSGFEKKPDLYGEREEPFWDDPHISQQMLEAHLNSEQDAASYKHKTIDGIVEWLVKYLNLKEKAKVLDLGCGPGLYCTRFSRHGLDVVGMDYSKNSINYARKHAESNCLSIQYICQDYLTMDYSCEFDCIFLIYCDFGALSDCSRSLLLQKIHKALKPGGMFIFDVFTRFNWDRQPVRNWYVSESGFWRPFPHFVLEQAFHYEKENVFLKQYIIIDNSGKVSIYNLSDHYYSKQSILQLMEEHGFCIQDIWSNLTGRAYAENTKCLGVTAKKLVK